MKRLKTILLFLVICISCFAQNRTRTNTSTNKRVIWEYKVVKVSYNDYDYSSPKFRDQTAILDKMDNEGWEIDSLYIDSVYTEKFPNFSFSERDLDGIHINTRTAVVKFVFKRPKSGK